MHYQRLYPFGLILVMAVMSGAICPAPAQPKVFKERVTGQGDGIPRITPQELLSELRRRRAILVDVRGLDAYKEGHIKGAISIPVDQVEARLKELPRGKLIATYCS